MDSTITEDELARHLRETLDRVQARGDRLTIAREGHPIAVLTPAPAAATWRTLAEHLAAIGFPGEGFADDVEAAQSAPARGRAARMAALIDSSVQTVRPK